MRMAFLALLMWVGAAPFVARAEAPPFEMSDAGLYRRESDVFEQLWVRKQFDVRSYHKVMFAPSFIQYRALTHVRADGSEWPETGPGHDAPEGVPAGHRRHGFPRGTGEKPILHADERTRSGRIDGERRSARRRVVRAGERCRQGRSADCAKRRRSNSGARTPRLDLERDHGPRERSRGSDARRRHGDGG